MFEALAIEAHGQRSHDVVLNVVAEKWRTAASSQGRRRMMTSAWRQCGACPTARARQTSPQFAVIRTKPYEFVFLRDSYAIMCVSAS